MPNKHRVDSRLVAHRIPIELAVKVEKLARLRHETVKQTVISALEHETEFIELNEADAKLILEEIRENERKRNQQRD